MKESSRKIVEQIGFVNKEVLAKELGAKQDISQEKAMDFINDLADVIGDCLAEDLQVKVAGFFNFSVSHRKARETTNPQDITKKITIDAHKVIMTKPTEAMKRKVAGK